MGTWDGMVTQRDTGMETCLFSSRCLSWPENRVTTFTSNFEEFTLVMTNVVHNNTISEPNQSQDGHRLGNI